MKKKLKSIVKLVWLNEKVDYKSLAFSHILDYKHSLVDGHSHSNQRCESTQSLQINKHFWLTQSIQAKFILIMKVSIQK